MRIEEAILRRVEMPLKFRFRTSFGETSLKKFLLLELRSGGNAGWGECVAEEGPFYSPETIESASAVVRQFLLPIILERDLASPAEFETLAAPVRGNRMAKAMISCALHALFAEREGVPLARHLGGIRDRIESGVSLGISRTVKETVANVKKHVDEGYRRIKLKIEPGADLDRVTAVRKAFPETVLTVDANGAYTLSDAAHLSKLDAFGLDYIEQPLHHEDLADHAELAKRMSTPICLDESIRSVREVDLAIRLGACRVVNIKVGRVGGFEEAIRIEERCRQSGVPVWCGGMLEAGVGRAHNVALSSRAGFVKPGDISSASRYFEEDIVEPLLETREGWMPVPSGPGLGVQVRRDVLGRVTRAIEEFR